MLQKSQEDKMDKIPEIERKHFIQGKIVNSEKRNDRQINLNPFYADME